MDFRGHLRLPNDAGSGIPVVLRVDDIYVIITAEGEELGAWRADDVQIDRIFSNQFALDLDGEPMVFIAADALGFAYEGVTAINDLRERLTKRKVFKRGRKKSVPPGEAVSAAPVAEPIQVLPPVPEPADQPARASVTPQDEPVLLSTPTPLWTPPATAAKPPMTPEPEPVQFETEPTEPTLVEPSPPDERVSYETPPPLPPPPTVSRVSDEVPQPVPPSDPIVEIEDVAPAAAGDYASSASAPVEMELEIDDYVMPAAGTADTYAAPAPRERARQLPPTPVEVAVEPEVEPRIRPSASPLPDPVAVEPVQAARDAALAEEAVEEPVDELADEPLEEASLQGFNGHKASGTLAAAPPEDRPEEIEGSRRDRRKHSLFGRSKDRKEPEHEHKYGPPNTIGGLTRSVCEGCGHVTFSSQDVYQDW